MRNNTAIYPYYIKGKVEKFISKQQIAYNISLLYFMEITSRQLIM